MSVLKFPEYLYEIAIASNNAPLGTFTTSLGYLSHIQMGLWVHNVSLFTNERIRLRAERSDGTFLYSSWVNITDVIDTATVDWLGFVRFDFNRETLQAASTLELTMEYENYTFDQSGTGLGAPLNWLDSNGAFSIDDNKAVNATIFYKS